MELSNKEGALTHTYDVVRGRKPRPHLTTAVKLGETLTVDRGVTDVVGEDDISG